MWKGHFSWQAQCLRAEAQVSLFVAGARFCEAQASTFVAGADLFGTGYDPANVALASMCPDFTCLI